jgi:hypothetical protein
MHLLDAMRWKHPALAVLAVLFFLALAFNVEAFMDMPRLVTGPLSLIAIAYLLLVWIFPLVIGRERPDTAQRVERVRASGPPTASMSCSAQLGKLRMRGPLLNVTVHPGGIILKPIFMAPRGMLVSEIEALEIHRQLWMRYVSIRHTAPDVASKVVLYISVDSPVSRAIQALIGRDAYDPKEVP